MPRYPALRSSSFRGRRTPEQAEEAAQRRLVARKDAEQARLSERDSLVMSLISVCESIRRDANIDARRVYRVEIDLDDREGGAVAILHSRVFPSQKHVVSPAGLQEAEDALFGEGAVDDNG